MDGDGKLDVIVNIVSVGVIRDKHALFVKMKFDTDIFKFSLDDMLAKQEVMHIPAKMSNQLRASGQNLSPMRSLKYKSPKEQIWGGYMGTTGDSIYYRNWLLDDNKNVFIWN